MAAARQNLASVEALHAKAKVEKEYKKRHKDWPNLEDIPKGDSKLTDLTPHEKGLRDARLEYQNARVTAAQAIRANTEGVEEVKAKASIDFALQEHTNRLRAIAEAKGEKPSRLFAAISNTIGKVPPKLRLPLMALIGTAGAVGMTVATGGTATFALGLAVLSRRLLGGVAGAAVGGAVGKILFGRSAEKYNESVAKTTIELGRVPRLSPTKLAEKLKELDGHMQEKLKRDKHARWWQMGAAAAAGAGTGAFLTFGGGDALLHQVNLRTMNPLGVSPAVAGEVSAPGPGASSLLHKPDAMPAPEGGFHRDPYDLGGDEKNQSVPSVTREGESWSASGTSSTGEPAPEGGQSQQGHFEVAKDGTVLVKPGETPASGPTPSPDTVLYDDKIDMYQNDQKPTPRMMDPFARFAEPGSPGAATAPASAPHWAPAHLDVPPSDPAVAADLGGNPVNHIPEGKIPQLDVKPGDNDWTLMRAGLSDLHSPYFQAFAQYTEEQQKYVLDGLEKLARSNPEIVKQILMGQHLDTHGHGTAFVDMVRAGDKVDLHSFIGVRSDAVDKIFNDAFAQHGASVEVPVVKPFAVPPPHVPVPPGAGNGAAVDPTTAKLNADEITAVTKLNEKVWVHTPPPAPLAPHVPVGVDQSHPYFVGHQPSPVEVSTFAERYLDYSHAGPLPPSGASQQGISTVWAEISTKPVAYFGTPGGHELLDRLDKSGWIAHRLQTAIETVARDARVDVGNMTVAQVIGAGVSHGVLASTQ